MLADVSTPTVSRFESGAKDIQLSSAMTILAVLGMVDKRILIFPQADARYDPIRMVVLFDGNDGEKTVPGAISWEALDDHFDGEKKNPAKAFRANCDRIQHEARRKFLAGSLEPDGSVLIKAEDL